MPPPYGEILGYGATQDACHPVRPAPDARQLARAIELALSDAGIRPEDVDVIFADAAGTIELRFGVLGPALCAALGAILLTSGMTRPR